MIPWEDRVELVRKYRKDFEELLLLALTMSCAQQVVPKGKAIIIKQWHPSPSVNTVNIQDL